MYNAFLLRTKETISALGKHIQTSDRFRTAVFDGSFKCAEEKLCFGPETLSTEAAPDRLEWRVIDHCAAVTRIYAIYEQFAHEMIREHLGLLQGRILFSDLPDKIHGTYRSGLAKILDKKDGPRFGDIDLGKLISGYDSALRGEQYAIEPRAMLMQEQNLRLPELERFMGGSGIEGMAAWIKQHSSVVAFFAAEDRLTASAESEMAELIKYRNDAAHGSIDISNILSVNVLLEFCEFVSAVCEAMAEKVQLAGLLTLEKHGHVTNRGKISESLRDGLVAIGKMTGEFKVGSAVYLCGPTYCLERRVDSLQLDSINQETVQLSVATELGIQFDAPGKKNAALMMFEPEAEAEPEADLETEAGYDLKPETESDLDPQVERDPQPIQPQLLLQDEAPRI